MRAWDTIPLKLITNQHKMKAVYTLASNIKFHNGGAHMYCSGRGINNINDATEEESTELARRLNDAQISGDAVFDKHIVAVDGDLVFVIENSRAIYLVNVYEMCGLTSLGNILAVVGHETLCILDVTTGKGKACHTR